MDKNSCIYIAGNTGLVGRYLERELVSEGYFNLLTSNSKDVDLTNKKLVDDYFKKNRPEYVFLLAARRGSIEDYAKYPVDYFSNDMQILLNVLECAHKYSVKKLLFTGSVCVYPEQKTDILSEKDFRSSWVPISLEAFALAKAAGIILCEYYNRQYGTQFVSALLGNIYGGINGEELDVNTVIPAMIKNFHDAMQKTSGEVVIWGDGKQKRDFLHAKDCAKALLTIMNSDMNNGWINVASGESITINTLTKLIGNIVGFQGEIKHDLSKKGGEQRPCIDVSKLYKLGWRPEIKLTEGIQEYINAMK